MSGVAGVAEGSSQRGWLQYPGDRASDRAGSSFRRAIGVGQSRLGRTQVFLSRALGDVRILRQSAYRRGDKKNGDRMHVTGASVDGGTYKTKQTIEINYSNPPGLFHAWGGGRARLWADGLKASGRKGQNGHGEGATGFDGTGSLKR
jgi:hypothetical protein